jgi:hypothetical protein
MKIHISTIIFNEYFHSEIEIADIKLALSLLDSRTTGINNKLKCIHEAVDEINNQPLPPVNDDSLLGLPRRNLLTRTHTYVAGHEAYPDVPALPTAASSAARPVSSESGSHGVKRKANIITINPNISTSRVGTEEEDLNQTSMV